MKLTITHNGFHGYTGCTIEVKGMPGDEVALTSSQVKKLARKACGLKDCTCGESMLDACENYEPWKPDSTYYITIPTDGNEIKVKGHYPQR